MGTVTVITRGLPELPLTAEVREAYEDLYTRYENAIENTVDTNLLELLNASQAAVAKVLALDDDYRAKQNTGQFEILSGQIGVTNKKLDELQDEIKKVAADLALYAGILEGVNKVLSLMPGI
jgi:hypothetical protein